MNKREITKRTRLFAKKTLAGEGSGHDWWHVYRVWKNAQKIGRREKVDMFVVELAALLHDIADWKLHGGDESVGPKAAEKFLIKVKVDQDTIDAVKEIIKGISFKGAKVKAIKLSTEGQVVQDADRLDAIGAIGIGRAFAYGGYQKHPLWDPGDKPKLHATTAVYKNNRGTAVNHFYEKLLLLKKSDEHQDSKKYRDG